ncbi:polysaccharide deacetylase family protein [Synechococcus sp. PCC 6312]|uniref:polysaccharide deacetylase family protein n=1 Tax=Synechococcus sp. (strain ATCC 27167 / PCC 6312) TaxID=195253 RepID=UPI00029F17CD|nr:polysaccharide deacetylase family protein [Synechococcus sp. PCC 6312]AFY61240.1 putative xylanase/chitin deacetylase [Synechococcus sp. PCC 6312]
MHRRDLFKQGLAAGAGALATYSFMQPRPAQAQSRSNTVKPGQFWPDGIRMPMSLSLMFETGAQPATGAPTPFGNFTPPPGYYDMPTITWYRYGYTEGVPRILDVLDKYKIKITSHMSGRTVEMYPDRAREIVQRGHEAAAHGWNWDNEFNMSYEQEKAFIQRNVDMILKVTGQRAVGYNAPGLRGSVNVLNVLNELGFVYHIDDVSRDEPFIVKLLNGKTIVVVPYAVYMNDIRAYEARFFSSEQYLIELKNSFDRLYEESAYRRRMMAVTMHDRLQRPEHVQTFNEFLEYIIKKPGVTFMKKIDIANFANSDPNTIRENIADVYPNVPNFEKKTT